MPSQAPSGTQSLVDEARLARNRCQVWRIALLAQYLSIHDVRGRRGESHHSHPHHHLPLLPSRLPSARTPVERAWFLASRWSALLYERSGRQGPRLLGLPGSMAGAMGAPSPRRTCRRWWVRSILEPERPRRRHALAPAAGCRVLPHASGLPTRTRVGEARRAGRRQERGRSRSRDAAGGAQRSRELDEVEKPVTGPSGDGAPFGECAQ